MEGIIELILIIVVIALLYRYRLIAYILGLGIIFQTGHPFLEIFLIIFIIIFEGRIADWDEAKCRKEERLRNGQIGRNRYWAHQKAVKTRRQRQAGYLMEKERDENIQVSISRGRVVNESK